MRWRCSNSSQLFAVAASMALSIGAADASVILTPSNPSILAVYPTPIPLAIEENQKNDGFIVIDFGDKKFEAPRRPNSDRGFSTTDGSGIPYLDALLCGCKGDGHVVYGDVPHVPIGGSILVSLFSGTNANVKDFLVGYHDDIGLEYETRPAVAFVGVPAPPTLPLFAAGLGMIGWLSWRRRHPLATKS